MERNRRSLAVVVLVSALGITGCGGSHDDAPRLRIEVLATRPHDQRAFTEGLAIDGTVLYEGTAVRARRPCAAPISAPGPNSPASICPPRCSVKV